MKVNFKPTKYNQEFIQKEFAPVFRTCMEAFFILTGIFSLLVTLKPELGSAYIQLFESIVEQLGADEELTKFEMFNLLFSNNLSATATTAISGFIPFFFYPAFTLGLNTFSLAAMGAESLKQGLSLAAYIAGILPHGIFEIPALMYACAIGICHCKLITRAILRREQPAPWREQVVSLSLVFITVMVPLLLIAAVIESFITPAILNLFI